jgi:hypothetical protein
MAIYDDTSAKSDSWLQDLRGLESKFRADRNLWFRFPHGRLLKISAARASDVCVATSLHDGMNLVASALMVLLTQLVALPMVVYASGGWDSQNVMDTITLHPLAAGADRRLLVVGGSFCLIGAIGLVRFKDFFMRLMHPPRRAHWVSAVCSWPACCGIGATASGPCASY